MLEVQILSWLMGSLGLQSLVIGGWWRWQQVTMQRYEDEEEEQLTPYESKDVEPVQELPLPNGYNPVSKDPRLAGWEFKIVRANRDLFRDPGVLKHLCKEEAQAGWVMLEKLDDRRIRFKRPIALRDIIKPEHLSYDPYRTHYGSTTDWLTALGAIALLITLLLPAYLGYALVSITLSNHRKPAASAPTPAIQSPTPPTPLR